MFIFGILATWKCDFWSFVNGTYYFNNFGYTCFGIRNICKDHPFLNVNSHSSSCNTRIPHLKSCIRMSNDESLINVIIIWVFHSFHFRYFTSRKCDFWSFVNGNNLVNDFGYTCFWIRNICKDNFFLNVFSDC